MKEQLTMQLRVIAMHATKPFCYGCYIEAPTGRCATCGSDDLMRVMPGVGCEYGTDWVIRELLHELEAEDLDERFENTMREVYPEETTIGFLRYDTVSAMKELDPVAWDLAKSEWIDSEEQDEHLVSFDNGSTYFDTWQVQQFISSKDHELGLDLDA